MLKFEVLEFLHDNVKEEVLNIYYNHYKRINKIDIFDSFLEVTKGKITDYINNKDLINSAKNINYTLRTLNDLNNNYLLIRENKKIIGIGRINIINRIGYVLEIAFNNTNNEKWNIWEKAILFLEKYFIDNKCLKMIINIPFSDGPLLIRASELGFSENPSDITPQDEFYVLSKLLES